MVSNVKDHFEREAHEFDSVIIKLIPYYPQMLDALITSIPFAGNKKINVIDCGCGTGTISKKVKESFPNAAIHCVDIAENMMEIARRKLSAYADITYEIADLSRYTFSDSYDVVLSSLALHHLTTDKEKWEFFIKIFNALNRGGVFYNADEVIGSNEIIQENCMAHWKGFMRKAVSEEEIEQKWIKTYEAEDRPAKLMDQMSWLRDIGFKDGDVIWKYFNFAVYGGAKK